MLQQVLVPLDAHEYHTLTTSRWQLQINGIVQGVGFRPFVHHLAGQLELSGWIRNTTTGVEIELQGPEGQLHHFLNRLQTDKPPLAHIISVEAQRVLPVLDEPAGLTIRQSDLRTSSSVSVARTLVSPDVATCAQCLHELAEPTDRRYRHPFANCTHCGPRFTIVTGLPYDRPLTTMAYFPLCHHCQQEYDDPQDRRFHAQPIACPQCGPEIWFASSELSSNRPIPECFGDDALKTVARYLNEGRIIAIKGIGGVHLACRADDDVSLRRLRESKARPHKPLAVMVSDVAMARQFCRVSRAEEALLTSPSAPIVLLRWRDPIDFPNLSEFIAPRNGAVGIMLPYTPLHHLLLRAVNVPLVMTSGNRPGEPLCRSNEQAWAKLRSLCDGFLLHDRDIARRCDDSVLFVADFGDETIVQPVRRSRGYVPMPVLLPPAAALDKPLVAAGADLKNVSAVAAERHVFPTQHIGNLDSPNVRTQQVQAIVDFEQLFNVTPQTIVCDLHPDYASSRYARSRAQEEGLRLVEVQHHHAHIAACLAENEHTGQVIGLAFDGTGYGSDGRIWGGEVLLADLREFRRFYHLEYLPLPGGDAAIRRPYRTAIAYLHTLCPNVDVTGLLPNVPPHEIEVIRTMLAQEINTPLTSSMGRLFDAVSALLGLCQRATYEAQAAIALESGALKSDVTSSYSFALEDGQIRLGQLLGQVVADRLLGEPISAIARRFHNTVAAMAVAAAKTVCAEIEQPLPVALSGGVWQNRLLLEMTVPLLRQAGFDVLLHRQVPANDGGLAYGQAVVAAALLQKQ